MSGPRFAHLTGRPMWEHCDHVGTRIEGTPAAVVLAPATGATDGAPPPASPADYAAWLAGYGSAVILPCAPDQCDGAQVLLQGYRPGALAALGWSPQALAERRPGIVVAALSAYGDAEHDGGPWAGRRGFDSLVQTATGFNLAEAEAFGSAQPRAMPVQILDFCAGRFDVAGFRHSSR